MDPSFVRWMDRLYLVCIWLAGGAILLMSLIIPWGVFMRYVLGRGAQWPEPIAILLMVVFSFFGAAASYRAGSHIAVTMLTDSVPPALRRACEVLVDLLMVLVCLFVAWYGTRLCIGTWNQSLSELSWLPVGVTYAPLPLGALATMLFVIERIVFGSQIHRPLVRFEEQAVAAEGAH
jgi:TRAP-type C4-dicarboxylate transport system permease small subunit